MRAAISVPLGEWGPLQAGAWGIMGKKRLNTCGAPQRSQVEQRVGLQLRGQPPRVAAVAGGGGGAHAQPGPANGHTPPYVPGSPVWGCSSTCTAHARAASHQQPPAAVAAAAAALPRHTPLPRTITATGLLAAQGNATALDLVSAGAAAGLFGLAVRQPLREVRGTAFSSGRDGTSGVAAARVTAACACVPQEHKPHHAHACTDALLHPPAAARQPTLYLITGHD
jgi:hypothetical protein